MGTAGAADRSRLGASGVGRDGRDHLLAALSLYERRPDQRYSLADCLSMTMMDDQEIRYALTFDRDFHGERRYTVLPGPR